MSVLLIGMDIPPEDKVKDIFRNRYLDVKIYPGGKVFAVEHYKGGEFIWGKLAVGIDIEMAANIKAVDQAVRDMRKLYRQQGWKDTDVHFSLADVECNLGVRDSVARLSDFLTEKSNGKV